MRRGLIVLAILVGALWIDSERASTQVANEDQRIIRAMESQASSLKSIAASLKKIEKCH